VPERDEEVSRLHDCVDGAPERPFAPVGLLETRSKYVRVESSDAVLDMMLATGRIAGFPCSSSATWFASGSAAARMLLI